MGREMQASGGLGEVDILELSESPGHLPHQHGTGAADGEGFRPETETVNGRGAIN